MTHVSKASLSHGLKVALRTAHGHRPTRTPTLITMVRFQFCGSLSVCGSRHNRSVAGTINHDCSDRDQGEQKAQNHAQKSPPSGRAMAHAQAMRQQQHRRVHREPNACSAARNTLSTARRVATRGRSQNEKLTLLPVPVSIPLSFLHGSWGVGAGRDGGEWHTSPDPPCAICSHHSHL